MNRFVNEFHPEHSDIALCGSMSQKEDWFYLIIKLRAMGYKVSTPELTEAYPWESMTDSQITKLKGNLIRRHIANIQTAKAVFIANFDKAGIVGYIGANCFLEMGAGFIYEKPIYLWNGVPEQSNREEILALEPIVLAGDLNQLTVQPSGEKLT